MFINNLQNKDLSKQKKATLNEDDLATSFEKIVNIKKHGCETKKRNTSIFSFTEEANVNINLYNYNQDIDEAMNMLTQVGPIFIQNTDTGNQVSPIMTEEHFCGDLSVKCIHCGALNFAEESNRKGSFKNCCHFGKVRLEERREYPELLKRLITGTSNEAKNFKANIRSYNSALSFSSLGAQMEIKSNGPYCLMVHGQIYHCVYHLDNVNGERKYSQLYVVDTEMATNIRTSNAANNKCDYGTMFVLDETIRAINPYSNAYMNMKNVVMEAKKMGKSVEEYNMVFNRNINRDQRRYNSPTASEIAMVFSDPNGEPPFDRDVRIYTKGKGFDSEHLNILSPHIDPMSYVLFFPHGETGWQPNLALMSYHNVLQKISMLQYKIAQVAIKEGNFNPILYGGKLFQQWIIDSYLQVEANNLNYIKLNQKKLRVDYYKGMVDYINNGSSETSRPIILPSTFQGSPRNMKERYHDAMAIVTKHGKPDLFITMTCNPNWPEIKNNLFEGQTVSDRPDLVARVFNLKLKALLSDILSGKVFGEVIAHVYSIEFQKRGLPHAHMLFILRDKIDTADKIDKYVSAEIPDKTSDVGLYNKVLKHMIHGPCGIANPQSPCMENGICTKEFPKEFSDNTIINRREYPQYKRRSNTCVEIKKGMVSNSFVVPYNKYLLAKYNCHINVEVCTSVKSVKYIFKYIYKGYDCAELEMTNNNEISQFLNTRYVSPPEAMWRLLENKMHDRSHDVIRLPVHLPQEQIIIFEEGKEDERINRGDLDKTMLLAYFKLNLEDPEARKYFYSEIPNHYVYSKGEWKKRLRANNKIITRMYAVSMMEKERFYLRLLLLNVKGSTSYESLRSFNTTIYNSFEEAAEARGLLNTDKVWEGFLEEAVATQSAHIVRLLFCYICSVNRPRNPVELYNKFKEDMMDDYTEDQEDRLLNFISNKLSNHGWSLKSLGLPEPMNWSTDLDDQQLEMVENTISNLNKGQREAFDNVVASIEKGGRLFFIDGPAGTGKTYLYNAIIYQLHKDKRSVIQLATTGIAADLLADGRTVHSGMKLPVPLNEASISKLKVNSPEATRLRNASLILIDEVSMMSKYALNAIDEVLRRLCNSEQIFGGKVIVLGGDFRQTANVVLRGSVNDIVESSIQSSSLWRHVEILRLSENMRAQDQPEFTEWLMKIGNGSINDGQDEVLIPSNYLEKNDIVKAVFGEKELKVGDESVNSKIILATRNEDANVLNNQVLNLLEGQSREYCSADSIISDDPTDYLRYPIEFLYKQQPSGMPPHLLKLKVGAVVMLLRNLDPKSGLLNGTRLIVKELHTNFIIGQILTGKARNTMAVIPKIDMIPSESILPFVLKRRQFPVIVSYAMTIHKAQGQSFDTVGVYLPEPVFTHGQLYVALSRVKQAARLKIYLPKDAKGKTKNIVYKALLTGG